MKKVLLTCTDLMAVQFFVEHILFWSQNGLKIDLICSPVGQRMNDIRKKLENIDNISIYTVDLQRSPVDLSNWTGYRQMKSYIKNGNYDLIITNEPVMGLITRLAARHAKCSVIYITHGFHFYHGAPFLNYCIFYSIERLAAKFTDVIITINQEDYAAAQKFKLRNHGVVGYIPGIGADLSRFRMVGEQERAHIRNTLGIQADEVAVVVVGELNENKNQQILIRALAMSKNCHIKLYFAGKGDQRQNLLKLAAEQGVLERVIFLGYRKDLHTILPGFDIGASASKREGLGLNLIEEMACGLPIVASNNRGHRDIIESNGGLLFDLHDVADVAEKLDRMAESELKRKQWGHENLQRCRKFGVDSVKQELFAIIYNNLKTD